MKSPSTRTLVLGASGFIGGAYARRVDAGGGTLLSVGRSDHCSNAPHYQSSSMTRAELERLFEDYRPTLCLNAAGTATPSQSVKEPRDDLDANTILVADVLESMRKSCPKCRYIGLSSAAVYGDSTDLPWKESALLLPRSPYGYHKYLGEVLAQEYHRLYGLESIHLRIFSAYGPGLRRQLFWDAFQRSRNTLELHLFGTGKETRDFIFIDELVRAIDIVYENAVFNGQVVNLASGIPVPVSNACSYLLEALGWQGKVFFSGETMPGSPVKMEADIQLLQNIGFSPSIQLKQGLKLTAEWLLENGHAT